MTTSSTRPVRAWLALPAAWLGLLGAPAWALQTLDVRDGVAVEAVLSLKDATRIRLDGAPITDVFGNVYARQCAPSANTAAGIAASTAPPPAGAELLVECDRDKGEVYVRPLAAGNKPIHLYVASAHGTYTLLLRPSDTPADTIVLRERRPAANASRLSGADAFAGGASAGHVRALKSLLAAMAGERVPSDLQVRDTWRLVPLWAEAQFALVRTFEGRGLFSAQYLLRNVSDRDLVLSEPELDREEIAGPGVLGIAVEHHNLRPGESTTVFVIRRAQGGQGDAR